MLVQALSECARQTPNSAQLETCRSTFFNPPDKRVIALSKIREHKTLTEELHKNLLQGMGCCTKTTEVRITRVCLPQIHALWQPAVCFNANANSSSSYYYFCSFGAGLSRSFLLPYSSEFSTCLCTKCHQMHHVKQYFCSEKSQWTQLW